jgi:hypothetical protein
MMVSLVRPATETMLLAVIKLIQLGTRFPGGSVRLSPLMITIALVGLTIIVSWVYAKKISHPN